MDWFNANATSLIAAGAALSGTIVAAVFTFINNVQSIKAARVQRNEQYNFEKWKENRKVYIEKGEEMISLVSAMLNHFLGFVNISALDVISSGKLEVSDRVKSRLTDPKSADLINRVDTVATSYFPSMLKYKDEMIKKYQRGIFIYLDSNLKGIGSAEVAKELFEIQDELENIARLFKAEISKVISEHL